MLAKVIWFDSEHGLGVVKTLEGREYHVSMDMIQSMEQDSLAAMGLSPGMIVRVNPDATRDGSMVLGLEKVSDDEAHEFSRLEGERANRNLPESRTRHHHFGSR